MDDRFFIVSFFLSLVVSFIFLGIYFGSEKHNQLSNHQIYQLKKVCAALEDK